MWLIMVYALIVSHLALLVIQAAQLIVPLVPQVIYSINLLAIRNVLIVHIKSLILLVQYVHLYVINVA